MVRMAFNNQLCEVAQGESTSRGRKLLCMDEPSQNLLHLDVNQVRCVYPFSRMQCAGSHSLGPGRLQYQLYGR